MDCIIFNKDINAFMDDTLTDEELNDFLNHLRSCENCAEELEINYIVREGMIRLDDKHASLDLASAYKYHIKQLHQYMTDRKRLMVLSNVFRTITFWVVLTVIFVFLRLYFTHG